MVAKTLITFLLTELFSVAPGIEMSQNAGQNRILIINCQSTQVPVTQVQGPPTLIWRRSRAR
jgi:hypothetical protein